MLKRFEVTNFKNFKEKFVFDLSDTKNYSFNEECVENGIVKTGLIYGVNGCGKSNLGYAIFDITTHLGDDKTDGFYNKGSYQYAGSDSKLVEFKYVFKFGDSIIEYSYGKNSVDTLVYEKVIIDETPVLSIDRRISNKALINLKGAETLNRDFSGSTVSIILYVKRNSILDDNYENYLLTTFFNSIRVFLHEPLFDGRKEMVKKSSVWTELIIDEKSDKPLGRFQEYLFSLGIKETVCIRKGIDGSENLYFDFGNDHLIDFFQNASSGTLALTQLYRIIKLVNSYNMPTFKTSFENKQMFVSLFIFIDEFDAFYHHNASKQIIKILRDMDIQVLFTTHNTSIMTNDLLRPDCNFIMQNDEIKPLHTLTDRELRNAHNIEKMYKAGVFSE